MIFLTSMSLALETSIYFTWVRTWWEEQSCLLDPVNSYIISVSVAQAYQVPCAVSVGKLGGEPLLVDCVLCGRRTPDPLHMFSLKPHSDFGSWTIIPILWMR